VKTPDFFELKRLVHFDAMLKRAKERRRAVQCEGKHRFDSFAAAEGTMRPELRKVAKVYHCGICHAFHIGSLATGRANRLALKRRREECVSL
jgi:hypothetical protein